MSSIPHKDTEERIRKAKDRIVGGIADTRRQLGAQPDTKAAEDFAVPVLEKTLREREEQRNKNSLKGVRSISDDAAPQELPTDVRETRRRIGSVTFRGGKVVASDLTVPTERVRKLTRAEALAQKYLYDRLLLLGRYPDWKKKVEDAWHKTPGERQDRAAAVLQVVEESKRVFGELEPKDIPRKIIIT